ncbi:MAG: hypothetical protein ACE5F8_04545, partial [Woeseiaceae bacterium]
MYDWLSDCVSSGHVVTANQRLARTLVEEFNRKQRGAGLAAWPSPAIWPWRTWLKRILDSANREVRVRINDDQSRVLWERCLDAEIRDPLLNLGALARLSHETWERLHEWRVPLDDCVESARGRDQRMFARVAQRYRDELRQKGWIDKAMLPTTLRSMIADGGVELPSAIALAGFDRTNPQIDALCKTLTEIGVDVRHIETKVEGSARLHRFEDQDGELRAAGAWAREQLEDDP